MPHSNLSQFSHVSGSRSDLTGFDLKLDIGGSVAVYGERSGLTSDSDCLPWFVFHGGPGGRINSSLVGPLRSKGEGWFGFDQRNSGLSDDLPLESIDLQSMVDDAFAVADRLGQHQFNVLAGSWGATVALAMASQRPERLRNLILRAPFIPFRSRVDHFFELLESKAPPTFHEFFGIGWRTAEVASHILAPDSMTSLESSCLAWSLLEECLLGLRNPYDLNVKNYLTKLPEEARAALKRKYQLQSHFLIHDCFWSEKDWHKDIKQLALADLEVFICHGAADQICPADGSLLIKQYMPRTFLNLIPDCGHLAGSKPMDQAIMDCLNKVAS